MLLLATRVPHNRFFIAHSAAGAVYSVQYTLLSTEGDSKECERAKDWPTMSRHRIAGESESGGDCTGHEENYLRDRVKCIFIATGYFFYLLDLKLKRERNNEQEEMREKKRNETRAEATCEIHSRTGSRQEKCITVSTPHYNCKKRRHVRELTVKKRKKAELDSLKDA